MACYIYIPLLCACHMCELMQAMTITTNYTQLLGNPFYNVTTRTHKHPDWVFKGVLRCFRFACRIRFTVQDEGKGMVSKP